LNRFPSIFHHHDLFACYITVLIVIIHAVQIICQVVCTIRHQKMNIGLSFMLLWLRGEEFHETMLPRENVLCRGMKNMRY
jgi:hypothetical protein